MSCRITGRNLSSFTVSGFSDIGGRKTQEDTYVIAPELKHPQGSGPERTSACFGVYDGTVGDFASETVKEIIVPTLMQTEGWKKLRDQPTQVNAIAALNETYQQVDHEVLRRCAQQGNHYATCTSVTVIVVGDVVVVAHTGDARMIVGRHGSHGEGEAVAITIDHTPDLPAEKARIESCGGEVVKLQKHSNKPYIRGGDFMMRKALGEQPMQLQYGRAFGCKDLKIFGLTCEPEVNIISQSELRWLILGSDGIWGVVSPKNARDISEQAVRQNVSPAEAIVKLALQMCGERGIRADNLTAVVIQFNN